MKKDLTNIQFARVCNALFGRNNPTAAADDGIEPLADNEGRLIVLASIVPSPNDPLIKFDNPLSLIPDAGLQLWDGVDYRQFNNVWGFNNDSSNLRFLQLHVSVAAPVITDIPVITIPVPFSNSTYSLSVGFQYGQGVGLWAVVSSTPDTFTPIVGSLMYIHSNGLFSANPF
jgi:hypothetical protein